MNITSTFFLFLFLPAAFLGQVVFRNGMPKRVFLLLVSLFFYAWGDPRHLLLLVLMIAWNYGAAIAVAKLPEAGARNACLALAVISNLAVLFLYKYLTFFSSILPEPLRLPASTALALPLGISFFVFKMISFQIDAYRKKELAGCGILDFALYVSFFPQVLSGPIARFEPFWKQLPDGLPDRAACADGAERFMIGACKKLLLAEPAALAANAAFSAGTLSMPLAWVGSVAYTLQIYYDFSGYSDMAIGLGKLFGLDTDENFRHPYNSLSIQEFWRRWHISLSSWFRDYVYFPLGGSRCSLARTCLNTAIVFALTGLWHGANWTFVAWGLYHAVFLILERAALKPVLERTPGPVRLLYTMFVVNIGWILFRADSLPAALRYIRALFGLPAGGGCQLVQLITLESFAAIAAGLVMMFPLREALREKLMEKAPFVYDTAVTAGFLMAICYSAGSGFHPFLYVQF